MTSNSVEHKNFPDQKKIVRTETKIAGIYFEPMADGTGVKCFTVSHVNSKNDTTMKDLQSIQNLKRLLLERRETDASTSYLKKSKAMIEEEFRFQ